MRIVYGWSLMATMCLAGAAWGQEKAGDAPRPRAEKAAPGDAGARDPAGDQAPGARPGAPRSGRPGGAGRPAGAEGGAGGQAGRPAAQQGQWADQQIAAVLLLGARNEIEISKFAQEHLQSDGAKEFAAAMVKEHTLGQQKLQQLASRTGGGRGNNPGNADEGRDDRRDQPRGGRRGEGAPRGAGADSAPGAAPGARSGTTPSGATAGAAPEEADQPEGDRPGDRQGNRPQGARRGFNWVAVHGEIADECLKSTKEALSEHEGIDFDKAYLGQQIVAHMAMIDHLTVFKKHASSELQQDLDMGLAMANKHLTMAKELIHEKKDKE